LDEQEQKMKARQVKVIYNARVYIGREEFHEALIIEGGRIRQSGSSRDMLDAAPAGAEKLDARGCLVLPAFHDSHLHLILLGRRTGIIEAAGAASVEEVIRRGRELAARLKPPPGTFIHGAGVNPDLFSGEKRDLTREDLDTISREHPVMISRHCGHTIYYNSLALKMAGLDESAPNVEGGTIEKDEKGRPTGVFREKANALIRKIIPAPTRAETLNSLKLAIEKAFSLGITAVGSYDVNGPDFDDILGIYRELYASGGPRLRMTMQCGISEREDILDAYLERGLVRGKIFFQTPETGPILKMGPVKFFIDGTLGGQTAWMREPYRDKPETSGFPVMDLNLFERSVLKAAAGGMQVTAHAIGDAALETVIAALEKVTGPGHNPLRHSIIHCQISTGDLLERMARNKILALIQPIFLADDMYALEKRVGPEKASTSYAWGTMEKLGIPASYGSDAPISSPDPLLGLSWAVRRQNPEDNFPEGGFYPEERVDISTALDAYTAASAYASFDEDRLGRIKPGYLADLVFIDRDLFTIPPEEIHRARIVRTIMAGDTVFEGEG
jgi:predicted amidohydrolase YtcJ